MTMKIKDKRSIGDQIRDHFVRNQSWLSLQTGISESELSKKMKGKKPWKQSDLDSINQILGTSFKL